jgi:hypothetical protein
VRATHAAPAIVRTSEPSLVGREVRGPFADQRRTAAGERADGSGEVGDRVVPAEDAGTNLRRGAAHHRLLERGERPRFVRIGRQGAGERHEYQHHHGIGERVRDAGRAHHEQ